MKLKHFESEYKKTFKESIKCHHNEIANYFQDSKLQNLENNSDDVFIQGLKYYNVDFIASHLVV